MCRKETRAAAEGMFTSVRISLWRGGLWPLVEESWEPEKEEENEGEGGTA